MAEQNAVTEGVVEGEVRVRVAGERKRVAKIAGAMTEAVSKSRDEAAARQERRKKFYEEVRGGSLETVAQEFKATEVEFGEAMALYQKAVGTLEGVHAGLKTYDSNESAKLEAAKQELADAEAALVAARTVKEIPLLGFLRRRDKAVVAADARLAKAKTGLETAQREVDTSMLERIKNAPVEETVNDFLEQSDKVDAVLVAAEEKVSEQLNSVTAYVPIAFKEKEAASQKWAKSEELVKKTQADLERIEAELTELTTGSQEHAAKDKERAAKINELERHRAAMNLAMSEYTGKEKTLRELAAQEPALIQVKANIQQKIAEVRANKADRSVTFPAAIQLIRSMAEQRAADLHDQTGETFALTMMETSIKAFQASENARLERDERAPAEVQRRHEQLEAMLANMIENRKRDARNAAAIRAGYGTQNLAYPTVDVDAGKPDAE